MTPTPATPLPETAAAAPLVLSFPADLTTPVRAFLALTVPGQDCYLLESVTGGESQARFSFIGIDAVETFEVATQAAIVRNGIPEPVPGDPLAALARWAEGLRAATGGLPVPFLGGAVGWVDFSAFALAEPVLAASFPAARAPRLRFGRFTTGLVLDHLKQQGYLYHFPAPGESEAAAGARLQGLRARLEGALPARASDSRFRLTRTPDRAAFGRNFAAVQEAILAGEAYQIVISEPFEGRLEGFPFFFQIRLGLLPGKDVPEGGQGLQLDLPRNSQILLQGFQGQVVVLGQIQVELQPLSCQGGFLGLHEDLDPAPGDALAQEVPRLRFQGVQLPRQTKKDIAVPVVDRLDLHLQFLPVSLPFSAAVAGHALDHKLSCRFQIADCRLQI